MPQNAFFLRTCDLLISPKMTSRHFLFTLHPLSTVIFATATVLAFVLLRNSNFNFHCYTQREATSTQKSARKWAATSRDFFRKRLQSALTLANQHCWIAQYRHVTANCFQWRVVNLVKRHVSTPMYSRGLVVQTNTSCSPPPPQKKGVRQRWCTWNKVIQQSSCSSVLAGKGEPFHFDKMHNHLQFPYPHLSPCR